MTIDIRYLDSEDAYAWDTYVSGHPSASNYHQYRWRAFFVEVFKKRTYYITACDGDSIVGVLPLVRLTSRLFGDYLVSLPFFNYGGILADDSQVAKLLVSAASDLASDIGVTHYELREYESRETLVQKTNKVSMRLDLPPTPDELGKMLGSKIRSQIRRSDRENPVVLHGGVDLVDKFYVVFSRSMRDLGTPVYSKAMFVEILRRFPGQSSIVLIEIDGVPAAAAFLTRFRETMEVPWAATDRTYNRISLNMRLYWELLTFAIAEKLETFDFGRSSEGGGTYRFKKQWGAKPVQLVWNIWTARSNRMPELNPENKKYALFISIWKKLPVPVANFLGPHVVKNLP